MLAETIHSFADCSNQALLYLGVKQGQRPPDPKHPLGHGRAVYFWSFLVAMLLFSIGGMFSINEGIDKYTHPEPVQNIQWGVGVLIFSILLESYAMFSNVVEMNKRRRTTRFLRYLRETKDSDLVVIFGENAAAVVGLILALAALLAAYYTGDGRYDAAGSFAIGVAVAVFLAVEVKSLLIGESADPYISSTAAQIAEKHPNIEKILNCITLQQGPGEVMVCVKISCAPSLTTHEISQTINDFESRLRATCPEVRWSFVEPDFED